MSSCKTSSATTSCSTRPTRRSACSARITTRGLVIGKSVNSFSDSAGVDWKGGHSFTGIAGSTVAGTIGGKLDIFVGQQISAAAGDKAAFFKGNNYDFSWGVKFTYAKNSTYSLSRVGDNVLDSRSPRHRRRGRRDLPARWRERSRPHEGQRLGDAAHVSVRWLGTAALDAARPGRWSVPASPDSWPLRAPRWWSGRDWTTDLRGHGRAKESPGQAGGRRDGAL